MGSVRYAYARQAVHSLAHLSTLGDAPNLLLCVSERTLYLLQNFATWEIGNPRSYATAYNSQAYTPVKEADEQYALFKAVRDNAQLELMEGQVGCCYGIQYADLSGHQLLDVAAGNYTMDIDPVPEGEVWEVQQMHIECNPSPTWIKFRIVDGAGLIDVSHEEAPSALFGSTWQGKLYLSEGQNPACRVSGAPEGADITFYVWYAVLS